MNHIDLENRCAVITGGAQGIGRAIAERLLSCGAKVSLWDADEVVMESAKRDLPGQGQVETICVDVTDAANIDAAAAATQKLFGKIDILIAGAGIAGPNFQTWKYPVDVWKKVIDVNLNGVFHACRAVVPFMIAQNYGRIVNIASVAGKEGNPNAAPYSASKAGVIALTKSLGKELAQYNISVNCITPTACRTRIFEQITQQHIDYMLSKIPRARFVELEEISAMVSWLVSADNSYTTGSVFDLSGGRATY